MSASITFDGAPELGTIDFGVGQPSADLLPLRRLRAASERFFTNAQPIELNYGEKPGDSRFRAALADFLTRAVGHAASADSLFLTAGTSQALDFVCHRFTRPGDTVFVEDPTYFLAFQVFRDHGLDIIGIPLDGFGMDIDALEREIARRRPRLVYTIPTFNNPTGETLSHERRERLVRLSVEHDFTVVADEVYQLLYYAEPPPPALGTWVNRGNVLSLGSFSKIVAPGMRLGWIQTDAARISHLLASGAIISGGNFNHFGSHVVRQMLEDGTLAELLTELRLAYSARVAAMDEALHEHLGGIATWRKPEGGYFFWVTLPPSLDAEKLREAARAAGTGYQSGSKCSVSGGGRNCLRLCFAYYSPPEIREGIARLGAALRRAAR
jgi:DNA-binding transcriptional MocR family regulator